MASELGQPKSEMLLPMCKDGVKAGCRGTLLNPRETLGAKAGI